MYQKIHQMILVFWISVLCSACAGNPIEISPTAVPVNPTSQAMLQVTPVKGESLLKSRSVEYRNCSAKEVKKISLASEEQVHCTVTFADTATASTGAALPLTPEQKSRLEARVKDLFQPVFEKNASNVEQKVVEIPIDRVYFYRIYWKQLLYNLSASVDSDGLNYSVPYTYTLEVPQISLEMQKACTG